MITVDKFSSSMTRARECTAEVQRTSNNTVILFIRPRLDALPAFKFHGFS